MKKLITMSMAILALSLAFLFAISCDNEPETASIKLALDWYPNANHLGLFIAQQKGYFEEENLEVTMYTPSDPSTVLQTVGAGQDDFGMSYQPDVLLARNEGVPVVSILGVVQHPLNSLMTLESSGVTRPGQLVGKKVGYPGIPTNEPLLETMLKADGLNGLEDIELVNIGWNISESLISEKVDGVVGAYWTHESINMENIGYPVNVMRMEEWGVPDYYELVLVTSEDYLEENEDVAERFIRAIKRGFEEAISDPQAGVDVLVAENPGEIDEDIDRPGADLLVEMWQLPGGGGFGTQEPGRWSSFVQWMKDNDMLDQSLDASAAYRADLVGKSGAEPRDSSSRARGVDETTDDTIVTEDKFNEEWPLTVKSAKIHCDPSAFQAVWVDVEGKKYALNGMAQTHIDDVHDLDAIWRDDPDVAGLKVNVGPLIEYGLRLCE